ncbi:unnamed protein product [Brugia pahangi]|uniref:Uncharacterized protein n=1 Tax=Brugia pahangi TaxID=6280 RepID=A0A0N4TED4_BRUPA|nr:unnamed protein product [Brugia pahangi]
MRQKKSHSKSSTPQVEGFSLDGTPTASPVGTGSAGTSFPECYSNTDVVLLFCLLYSNMYVID